MLRTHGRPVQKAAALSLAMLCQLVATCDRTARGQPDRALLLIGFAGALRRSEVGGIAGRGRGDRGGRIALRIARSKTDPAGQGAEIGLPRGRHVETCLVRAVDD